METRKVTMKDVALESGISIKTVSNVINNNDSQMRPQTKSRVNKAIEKLGYSINHSAQALKKGRTGILGLAIPNFDQPFFGYFVDLLTKSARAHGYAIIISTFGNSQVVLTNSRRLRVGSTQMVGSCLQTLRFHLLPHCSTKIIHW